MEKNIERRTINYKHEWRLVSGVGKSVIKGTAALFNSLSEDLGGFREQIMPGAFKSALENADIRALFNHDPNMILGRTTSGTLRVIETDNGLEYECDVPDTTYARDLVACMQRGDITQCSFGFSIGKGGDKWEKNSAGEWTRTISAVKRLYDVSPVTYPAYPETECAIRSLEKLKAEEIPTFDDMAMRKLKLQIEEAII